MQKHEELEGVKIKSIHFTQLIGEGAYSRVYEGIDTRNNTPVAIKVSPKKQFVKSPKL